MEISDGGTVRKMARLSKAEKNVGGNFFEKKTGQVKIVKKL